MEETSPDAIFAALIIVIFDRSLSLLCHHAIPYYYAAFRVEAPAANAHNDVRLRRRASLMPDIR